MAELDALNKKSPKSKGSGKGRIITFTNFSELAGMM